MSLNTIKHETTHFLSQLRNVSFGFAVTKHLHRIMENN